MKTQELVPGEWGGNFGVAQRILIVNPDKRVLAIRRSETAPSRPLWWDIPGGVLEHGEDTMEGVLRELEEEAGITRDKVGISILDIGSGFNDKDEYWVTACYTAEVDSSEVKLSFEHSEYKWVTPSEFLEMKTSPRIKQFLNKLIESNS